MAWMLLFFKLRTNLKYFTLTQDNLNALAKLAAKEEIGLTLKGTLSPNFLNFTKNREKFCL